MHDWLVDPGSQYALAQTLMSGSTITVCSNDLPDSTIGAVDRWNIALGFPAFGVVFTGCSISSPATVIPEQHTDHKVVDKEAR
jgi:hypothetical protein